MNGIEATTEIRTVPELESLPIVAMSAATMQDERELCLSAGMNDHIGKPIDPETLWSALLCWVSPRTTSDEDNLAVASEVAPELAIPYSIEGLDTKAGLRRLLNRPARYIELLRGFVSDQADTPVRVLVSLENGDTVGARRHVHTLKGLAGTIGADSLQRAALALERDLAVDEPNEWQDSFAAFEATLAWQIDAIQKSLEPEHPLDATERPTENAIDELVHRLLELLEADDADAARLFSDNASAFAFAIPDSHQLLNNAIRNYDFETAIEVLNTYISNPGSAEELDT